jgi:hypothetical protein
LATLKYVLLFMQGERAHVIFISSADLLPSNHVGEAAAEAEAAGPDMIRAFWGGGDGSVGTGVISVAAA